MAYDQCLPASSPLVTVANDDPPPVIVPGSATIVEGNTGTQTLNVPVVLSTVSSLPVTVQWATLDHTATAPSDYTAASGTLTFAPGITNATVAITVNGDTLPEADEIFAIAFTNATNATIGGFWGLGFGTIQNDD
ncbi:MAG TPA: Calx-beta domain-containing protein [Acidimicrobiia bacterium]|nr:Calx-beta domain-containing protein [Acidimicrobiia bacterium]